MTSRTETGKHFSKREMIDIEIKDIEDQMQNLKGERLELIKLYLKA